MKNILWLIVGVGWDSSPPTRSTRPSEGKRFFEDVDSRAHEFSNAVVDG
jgi:hypothetical protein